MASNKLTLEYASALNKYDITNITICVGYYEVESLIFGKGKVGGVLKEFYSEQLLERELLVLHLGYSGVIVRGKHQTFAFDPADLLSDEDIGFVEKLDGIFYTHGHYDHYNRGVAVKLHSKTGAPIVAEESVASDLKGRVSEDKLYIARPGVEISFNEVRVTPVEGLHKGPIVLFLVEGRDATLFHGGDSAYVPLKEYQAQVALVPTGAPSPTASPEDAYKMVLDVKAKIALAFHGTEAQHRRLAELISSEGLGVKVIPLEKGKVVKVEVT